MSEDHERDRSSDDERKNSNDDREQPSRYCGRRNPAGLKFGFSDGAEGRVRVAGEKPRMMSFSDAIQIASALWVKEAGGVTDLRFLMFDDWSPNEAKGGARLSLLRLQDYAEDARANSDVMAAVRLTRIQPFHEPRSLPQTAPAE